MKPRTKFNFRKTKFYLNFHNYSESNFKFKPKFGARVKKLFFILGGLLLIVPFLAKADGMIVPQPDYYINETDQRAVIFYDKGVETLVLSITFKGNANDFGWVIPAPSKPEVSKGSDDIFTNLQTLTGYTNVSPQPLGLGVGSKLDESTGVTVIETKKVDYYDVTILTANDPAALTSWLEDNNFYFPDSASYILDSYVDNGWYFVAMKINPQSLAWSDVSQQLREGHATPVLLKFKTNNIVYPLKISSVVSSASDNNVIVPLLDETFSSPAYSAGIVGKGIDITQRKIVSFPADSSFSIGEGTIEWWFKPDNSWNDGSTGYWEFLSVVDSDTNHSNRDVLEIRRGKDSVNESLQFIAYQSDGIYQAWSTKITQKLEWKPSHWYNLAVTWSASQQPTFYVNGEAYQTEPAYSATIWTMRNQKGTTLYFGQRGDMFGSYPLRSTLDEVRISSKLKNADEIKNDNTQGMSTKELAVETDTLFLAHFNENLKEEKSSKTLSYEDRSEINYPSTTKKITSYTQPISATILLYIIADHKKELSGFSASYAHWIDKENIKKLALDDQGNPLIDPSGKKYFLTKLTRTMNYSDMTADLFPQNASNNDTVGQPIPSAGTESKTIFYIVISTGTVLTILLVIFLVVFTQGSRHKEVAITHDDEKDKIIIK